MGEGNASSGSSIVMADAQFTLVNPLRPFEGFEEVYQGQSVTRPIAFPGTLDINAGKNGYASNLLGAIPVPLGARLGIWIPAAVALQIVRVYTYTLHWRMRSLQDFRNAAGNNDLRRPYHLRNQSPGAPDTTVGTQPRFVVPCANDSIIYEQPEPATLFDPGIARTLKQVYEIGEAAGSFNPFTPTGTEAIFQQGVLDPAVVGTQVAGDPIFTPLWTDVMGDELLITVTRDVDDGANWDFAGVDLPFSNIYGDGNGTHGLYPQVGIYIFTGTNP